MQDGRRVSLILDSSHHGYRLMMVCKKEETEEEGFQQFRYMFLNGIFQYIEQFKADELIIAIDSQKNWRKSIFPQYKAHRKIIRKFDDEKEEGWFSFEKYFKVYNEFLQEISTNLPFKLLNVEYAEADDVAGILSHSEELKENAKIIVTSDQDYMQLLSLPMVKIYNPITKKFMETECPKKHLLMKAIMGDKGDNIPSIKDTHHFKPEFVEFCINDGVAKNEQNLKIIFENDEERLLSMEIKFLDRYGIKASRVMRFSEKLAYSLIEEGKLDEHIKSDETMKTKLIRNNRLVNLTAQPPKLKEMIIEQYKSSKINCKMNSLFTFFVKNSFNGFLQEGTKISNCLAPLYK
jgi:5'-3' exonuclease